MGIVFLLLLSRCLNLSRHSASRFLQEQQAVFPSGCFLLMSPQFGVNQLRPIRGELL
jgi:hypothetical protein